MGWLETKPYWLADNPHHRSAAYLDQGDNGPVTNLLTRDRASWNTNDATREHWAMFDFGCPHTLNMIEVEHIEGEPQTPRECEFQVTLTLTLTPIGSDIEGVRVPGERASERVREERSV